MISLGDDHDDFLPIAAVDYDEPIDFNDEHESAEHDNENRGQRRRPHTDDSHGLYRPFICT
jgi:hypothetical protein